MPTDHPIILRHHLEARSFLAPERCPAMAIDLDQMGNVSAPWGETAIKEFTEAQGVNAHTRLMAIGFGVLPKIETVFETVLQSLPVGNEPALRIFPATEAEQPFATSVVVLAGAAAGIFNVITLPTARRRGIGTAVTAPP